MGRGSRGLGLELGLRLRGQEERRSALEMRLCVTRVNIASVQKPVRSLEGVAA